MTLAMTIIQSLLLFQSLIIPLSKAEEFIARFTIPDNNPPQSPIGNIILKLQPKFPRGTYQIITRKCSYSKFNQYFRISDSGNLKIFRNFDRDDINNVCGPLGCCDKPSCEIVIDFVITVNPKYEKINVKVVIVILDENDNPPSFSETSFSVSVLENEESQLDHSVPIAVDHDSPIYGIKNYSLSGEAVTFFSIKMKHKQPFVIAKRSFDFEKPNEKQFNLSLTATDNGGNQATLRLIINIVDVNDNAPVFRDKLINLTLRENTSFPDPIITIKATDLDSNDNGKIVYSFSSTTLPTVRDAFHLESDTGNLFVTRKLDYELYSEQQFKFDIQATDQGSPQLSDHCIIRIQVTDVNDNSPVIDIVGSQPILENEPTNDPVLQIFVRDDDSIDNEVKCRPDKLSDRLNMKQMEKYSYFIYALGIYDYEKEKNLSLSIICQDNGKEPRFTNQLLTIPIKDANDNKPKFLKPFYRTSIPEDYARLKTFVKVQAVDKDSEDFGKIAYSVGLKDQKYFTIDNSTGEVKLVNSVDRESRDFFNISIIATDGGGLKDFSYIEVQILDVNDNVPRLGSGENIGISENSPIGSVVGHISVADPDLGENSKIEWTYDFIGNASLMLQIDNCTIFTSSMIDRESVGFLYILITMVDMGYPRLTASSTIIVTIIDENDNIPQIVYPKTGSLMEENELQVLAVNSPQHTPVLTVQSYDPDHGINGDVLYHILPSNGSQFFLMNETSGLLRTNWVYDTVSFNPVHPKEDIYKISYTAYNQVKSSKNQSSSISSFFLVKIGPYRHFLNNEVFYKYHRRPFFNNILLLILIGGFTISLSAALIAAIIWAKSKYSTESTSLEQAQANDGKFIMMMMMNGEQQNTNNTYLYDPYASLIVDADRTIDSGYAVSHSRSSTFNSRHNTRDLGLLNGFETKVG